MKLIHKLQLTTVFSFLRFGLKNQQIAGNSDKLQVIDKTSTESSKVLGVIESAELRINKIEGNIEHPGEILIGRNSEYISIGDPTSNTSIVEIFGKTLNIDIVNHNTTDKNITVNKNGTALSGADSGIDVEEDGGLAGFIRVNPTRDGWIFKALSTLGILNLSPSTGNFKTTLKSIATADQIIVIPDVSGTLSTQENSETLENKTLIAETTVIKKNTEERRIRFSANNVDIGNTSVISAPNKDYTLNTKQNWDNTKKWVANETCIFNLLEYRAKNIIDIVPITDTPKVDTTNWELLGVGDADLFINEFTNGLI